MSKIIKILGVLLLLLISGIFLLLYFIKRQKIHYLENTSMELYEPEVSTLHFPVYISVEDIQQLANKKLKFVLTDQVQPMKNQKDSLHLKVVRTGNLDFHLFQEKLYTSIPLKVDVVIIKKIGKASLKVFKKEPLSFEIRANLSSTFFLQDDMKINSNTVLESISWKEEPVAKIAGINIRLKQVVEKIVFEKAPDITLTIDGVISEKVNLKKPLKRVWENLQKNKAVSKETGDLFIKIQPHAVSVHVDKSMSDSIRLNLAVQSKLYVRSGTDTITIEKIPFPKKIKVLKQYDKGAKSNIHFHALLPLNKINEKLNQQLAGRKLNVPGMDIELSSVNVFNGLENVIGEITISGDLNGVVKTKGFPQFSEGNTVLTIRNIGIESQLEEDLVNSASDLLHSEVIRLLSRYARFELQEYVEQVPGLIRSGIRKTKLAQKANVSIYDVNISKVDVKLTKENIQILVSADVDFDISLKNEAFHSQQKSKKSE